MNGPALSPGWHAFDVDGVTQSYEVAGSGRMCVVHSGGPGIDSGYLRMPLLEDHLTMVYLDPIGTGRSGLLPRGEYFMPTYAHYFEAVLDHIDQPRPIILGHSHGGMVALELAMRDPHRLGGLIAYDTAPVYNDALWEEAGRQMSAYANGGPTGRKLQSPCAPGTSVATSAPTQPRRDSGLPTSLPPTSPTTTELPTNRSASTSPGTRTEETGSGTGLAVSAPSTRRR